MSLDKNQPFWLWILCSCAGLNENGPNSLTCVNTWFPVDKTVWGGLGGLALLEEVGF